VILDKVSNVFAVSFAAINITLNERKIGMFLELPVKIFKNINHSANEHERVGWIVKNLQILEASASPSNSL
jgi:hypothetical protein